MCLNLCSVFMYFSVFNFLFISKSQFSTSALLAFMPYNEDFVKKCDVHYKVFYQHAFLPTILSTIYPPHMTYLVLAN